MESEEAEKELYICGAGGFGREVFWHIQAIRSARAHSPWVVKGFFDDSYPTENSLMGLPVLGKITPADIGEKRRYLCVAIGDSKVKKEVVERLSAHNYCFPSLIHPSITGSDEFEKRSGVFILQGAVLTADVFLDDFVTVHANCFIGHESKIEKYSSLMPSVTVCGEARLHREVFVGAGATIINRVSIGEGSRVGAGSVVVNDIPSETTVMGVPAREKQETRIS
ncbi:acetyltransferase [bacterium]|nr:acetyltransferase [bacterium]